MDIEEPTKLEESLIEAQEALQDVYKELEKAWNKLKKVEAEIAFLK